MLMNQATSIEGIAQGPKRGLPFERVALVLQGGGALGAYQAGVYEAIHEARIEVDWICGTSIGGINGALIAGNPPERRVGRLREFWEAVTKPPISIPDAPLFAALWNGSGEAHWTNRLSALSSMIYGVPDFFTPRLFPPLISVAESPDLASYYDTAPLQATLARLVDLDLINSKQPRFSVAAANARTGTPVYFDSLQHPITLAHIMASASLPPSFPPTEIDWRILLGWCRGVELTHAIRDRRCVALHGTRFPSRSLGCQRRSSARRSVGLLAVP
jgi:NTE family protein